MKTLIAIIGFLTIGWTTVFSQSYIQDQILGIGVVMALDGYEISHDISYASLYQGQHTYFTVNLSRGYNYQVIAVCDEDCSDIDLKLFDENGRLIDSDISSDDVPVLEVTPLWSGRFKIWVKMYDCNYNPCRFGIAVFNRSEYLY